MSFDSIPEDRIEQHPCEVFGCNGSVSERKDGRWECDTCDWVSKLTYPTKEGKK